MKRLFSGMTMFCLLLLMTATAPAQDPSCICAHMPMYEVPGGWYHYATVHDQNCVYLYPTGLVNSEALPSQVCATTCGESNCMTLGDATCIAHDTFYFDKPLKKYSELSSDAQFKSYFGQASEGATVYSDYRFRAIGTVRLERNVGPSPFYAVVFEMRHATIQNYWSYIGIEISDPEGSTQLTVTSQCNAVYNCRENNAMTRKPATGLLEVRTTGSEADVIVVRMHKINNANPVIPQICAPQHDPIPSFLRSKVHRSGPSFREAVGPEGQTQSGVCQPNCQMPCNSCRPRRWRGRKCCW